MFIRRPSFRHRPAATCFETTRQRQLLLATTRLAITIYSNTFLLYHRPSRLCFQTPPLGPFPVIWQSGLSWRSEVGSGNQTWDPTLIYVAVCIYDTQILNGLFSLSSYVQKYCNDLLYHSKVLSLYLVFKFMTQLCFLNPLVPGDFFSNFFTKIGGEVHCMNRNWNLKVQSWHSIFDHARGKKKNVL